jgi:hypothetical protein
VHEHPRHPGLGHHGGHVRVGQAAAHVVDQDSARFDGGCGDPGPGGIDTDGDALPGELGDHWDRPGQLLLDVDAPGAGPGRLPADVDVVRAAADHFDAVRDGGLSEAVTAAVGEGVRGHVEDAHDPAVIRLS